MTIELTPEEAAVIYILAVGELSAIKTEEEEGDAVNENEINTLLAIANKVNPEPQEGEITWEQIPPAPEELV